MCGYVGRKYNIPEEDIHHWKEYANLLRLPGAQYYNRQRVSHLVVWGDGKPEYSEAIWWYMLKQEGEGLKINPKVTSFNARNLNSPIWKNAIRKRRGVLFGTEIGESEGNNKYLMESEKIFALGCVYKQWEYNGDLIKSFAVITRDPHPRFSQYHSKSIPLFLPSDLEFLDHWLNPDVEESNEIQEVLENPKLRTDFKVTRVKTYVRGEPLGESVYIESD